MSGRIRRPAVWLALWLACSTGVFAEVTVPEDIQPMRLFLPGTAVPPGASRPSILPPRDAAAQALDRAPTPAKRQTLAAHMMRNDPALAGPLVTALLQRGEIVSEALAAVALKLPPDAQLAAVNAHATFPEMCGGPFLRAAATGPEEAVAIAAISLLCGRHNIKNNATLETLTNVLASGKRTRISAVLDHFVSDSEFARMPHWNDTGDELTNDKFGAGTGGGSVLSGLSSPDFQPERRRVSAHIPASQWPSVNAVLRFLGMLELLARSGDVLPKAEKNRAYEIVLSESASAELPKATERLLESGEAVGWEGVHLAQTVALRYPEESRLLELVLVAVSRGICHFEPELLPRLAPFLVRDGGGQRTRTIARPARRLVASTSPENRLLGLMFIASHGAPADIALLRDPGASGGPSLLRSPMELERRAAAHAFSRLAPELFLLNAEEIAADPSPGVRSTLAYAFHTTGYRWEHQPSEKVRIAEWVPRRPAVLPAARFGKLLEKLSADPVPEVRQAARMALLQHGLLPASDKLADLASPPGDALASARLYRGAAEAVAAGFSVPDAIKPFLLPDAAVKAASERRPPFPVLAIFGPPQGPQALALDDAVAAFRKASPDARAVRFYNGTEVAARVRQSLNRLYDGAAQAEESPVSVFSSGAWTASNSAPDFALLQELASLGIAPGTPRRLEGILLGFAPAQKNAPSMDDDSVGKPSLFPDIERQRALLEHNIEIESKMEEEEWWSDGLVFFYTLLGSAVTLALFFTASYFAYQWYKRRPDAIEEKRLAARK
ncbi:MAG: hypothetical protein LBG65_03000 [Puniceicoccales bacterium]|nr:hypothetical protein [Puniceicoccales bacterium]